MVQSISVIVATHNGESFLREQLSSLRQQTMAPAQIILTDDNSTDSTDQILDEFAASSAVPVVRLKNVPALNYADNFLHATEQATSPWIAFCDQDDIWMPNKIEECSKYTSDEHTSLIVHTARLIDARAQDIGFFNQGITATRLQAPLHYPVWSTFFGFSMIFRKAILRDTNYKTRFVDYITPDNAISHDRFVCFLAQILGCTQEVDLPLVAYRQHSGNIFGVANKKSNKRRLFDRKYLKRSIEAYLSSTQDMVRIIHSLPDDICATFPQFKRAATLRKYERVLKHVKSRFTIYEKKSRFGSVQALLTQVITGNYWRMGDKHFHWQSLCKDLLFCLSTEPRIPLVTGKPEGTHPQKSPGPISPSGT